MKYEELERVLRLHKLRCNHKKGGRKANFTREDLTNKDFSGLTLDRVDFSHANLAGTDFSRANLYKANLCHTRLEHTDFRGAMLAGTCLDPQAPIPPVLDEILIREGFELDTNLEGHNIVCGWRTQESQHVAIGYVYHYGWHEAPWFSVDTETSCHPGIYLASEKWLEENYSPWTKIVRCWCYRNEILKAGDKFRTPRLFVEG